MTEGTNVEVSPARRHIIRRPRLIKLLDATKARIILLIAPAGYGKTTLARQWCEDPSRQYAWYAATPAAADVAALSAGIAKAVQAVVPGAGERMMERLSAQNAPPPDAQTLAELVADDLARWPEAAWLVVDDCHHAMASAASGEFLERVIETPPLRVLLTSRTRPNWATPRRIMYGDMAEVGEGPLSLTDAEVAAVLGERPTAEQEKVTTLAQGWPAAVGLTAMTHEPLPRAKNFPVRSTSIARKSCFARSLPSCKWRSASWRSFRSFRRAPSRDLGQSGT